MQTRASLLLRIRDARDEIAWGEFVRLYAPLLHAYGLRHGLQDADAADLAQDTLRNVLRAAPGFQYDPNRGTFRAWLLAVARNEIRKAGRRAGRQPAGMGDSDMRAVIEALPGPADDEAEWDREYQMNLFHWAARRVRPEFRENSWQAFWRTVVDEQPIETVAADLGLSPGAVYIARSRITARLRKEIETVEGT